MKKNYFSTFFAALMLLVAMPATAQVSSIADLVGKYKFSADMEITAAGESFSGKFTNECEVTIDKDEYGYFAGYITGIAGLSGDMAINSIDVDANTITILSPNTYMGAEGLYLSDITGSKNIYTGDETQYGDLVYTFDPTTKTFTLPDFSLVTKDDEQKVADIVAKFTNVTLTFIGGEEESAVTDLSGDWHFVAGDGEYDTMAGSTLPTEWDMTLTATDEFNKTYDATFKLGDFEPLTLSATFDGQTLTISFNEDYLDLEKKIGFVNMYGDLRPGEIAFTLENENLLKLGNSGITIYDELKEENLQWYLAGVATRSVAEEEEAFDWVGTYIVTVGEIEVANEAYTYPETYEMEIIYDETYGPEYVITKFFGQDVTFNQNGWGMSAYPSTSPNTIDITLAVPYGDGKGLVNLGGSEFLGMFDLEGNVSTIALKEENGVVKFDDFKVMYYSYTGNPTTLAATYKNVTAVKKGSEGETDIENTIIGDNTVEGIFDILGRKLDAITTPGLYIVNGKKVIVK